MFIHLTRNYILKDNVSLILHIAICTHSCSVSSTKCMHNTRLYFLSTNNAILKIFSRIYKENMEQNFLKYISTSLYFILHINSINILFSLMIVGFQLIIFHYFIFLQQKYWWRVFKCNANCSKTLFIELNYTNVNVTITDFTNGLCTSFKQQICC